MSLASTARPATDYGSEIADSSSRVALNRTSVSILTSHLEPGLRSLSRCAELQQQIRRSRDIWTGGLSCLNACEWVAATTAFSRAYSVSDAAQRHCPELSKQPPQTTKSPISSVTWPSNSRSRGHLNSRWTLHKTGENFSGSYVDHLARYAGGGSHRRLRPTEISTSTTWISPMVTVFPEKGEHHHSPR